MPNGRTDIFDVESDQLRSAIRKVTGREAVAALFEPKSDADLALTLSDLRDRISRHQPEQVTIEEQHWSEYVLHLGERSSDWVTIEAKSPAFFAIRGLHFKHRSPPTRPTTRRSRILLALSRWAPTRPSVDVRSLAAPAVLIGLAVAGVYYWTHLQAEREQQQETRRQAKQQRQARILAMATADGADTTWEAALAGNKAVRVSPLLTAEVQAMWLAGRPILFQGSVGDVIAEDGTFRLVVSYSILKGQRPLLLTDLSLSLTCAASEVSPLLAAANTHSNGILGLDVAVTARISRVEAAGERDGRSVLMGSGECIHVMLVGQP